MSDGVLIEEIILVTLMCIKPYRRNTSIFGEILLKNQQKKTTIYITSYKAICSGCLGSEADDGNKLRTYRTFKTLTALNHMFEFQLYNYYTKEISVRQIYMWGDTN